MTDQLTPETPALFVPPAARNLPLAALDSATSGADMLDARATTPTGRNFLAHALAQLARDGWLRTEPEAGFEPCGDEPAALNVRDRELEQLRVTLAEEQRLYRLRTEQWRRAIGDRQRTEELCRQLAAALTGVLAEPRIPDSGGETAVYIGPVPCVRVERWRGVLKEHACDGGPTVAEAAEQDAHWNAKYDRP